MILTGVLAIMHQDYFMFSVFIILSAFSPEFLVDAEDYIYNRSQPIGEILLTQLSCFPSIENPLSPLWYFRLHYTSFAVLYSDFFFVFNFQRHNLRLICHCTDNPRCRLNVRWRWLFLIFGTWTSIRCEAHWISATRKLATLPISLFEVVTGTARCFPVPNCQCSWCNVGCIYAVSSYMLICPGYEIVFGKFFSLL